MVWVELEIGEWFMVWMMMFWILLINEVMVVGVDFDYVVVEYDGVCYVLVEVWLGVYMCELGDDVVEYIVLWFKGFELVGCCYMLLFDFFIDIEKFGM